MPSQIRSLPYSHDRQTTIPRTAISQPISNEHTRSCELRCERSSSLLIRHSPKKRKFSIEEADDLYREIRIENRLTDDKGREASLKEGAEVEVQIEADKEATIGKT